MPHERFGDNPMARLTARARALRHERDRRTDVRRRNSD
jgi:hypothetical protein